MTVALPAAARASRSEGPAAHLVALPDPGWALWRTTGLRSAGFPAAGVLRLADATAAAAADAWQPPAGRVHQAPPGLASELAAAGARTTAELRSIAADPRFREAVTWQNRDLLPHVDARLADPPRGGPADRRKVELKVASYWQRYCVKNDFIGFFGPMGWARFADQAEVVSARPGPGLVRQRRVFFEGWAIEALAEAIAANPVLRPWLAPRRLPTVHLEARTLHRLYSPPLTVTPAEAVVLAACDGELTAREVATLARRNPASGLMTDAEAYRVLEALRARGLLSWGLELPCSLAPEADLRRHLEKIGDPDLRADALGALAELEDARREVARWAGDPASLGDTLAEMDAAFTRVTGRPAARAHGQTYGARRVAYEDCARDLDLELGPALLGELAGPLSLLLTSARWITHELAATYREAFRETYRAAAARSGTSTVELAQLAFVSLLDMAGSRAEPVIEEAARRWAGILALPDRAQRVQRSTSELRAAVLEAFPAPGPGWPLARYHSPDLMIDSPSLEALQAGDFELVLGELHLAVNSLLVGSEVGQHPSPADIQSWVEADLPDPTVVNVIPKSWERATSRTYPCLRSPKDVYLVMNADPGDHPAGRELPLAALVLEEVGGRLRARTRDGSREFDVAELFGLLLAGMLLNRFRLHPERRHLPRITIDRMVVARETWTLPATELAFAGIKDETARFAGARAWARDMGVPRFAFLRTPLEVKPVYVDFASPIYVALLCKLLRAVQAEGAGAKVTLTEMLPNPDRAWLPDRAGERYACELRLVAVDQTG